MCVPEDRQDDPVPSLSSSSMNRNNRHLDPLSQASIWSKFWFAWNRPLLELGCQRPIGQEDVPTINQVDTSRYNQYHIEQLWETAKSEYRKKKKNGNNACTNYPKNLLAIALGKDYLYHMWYSRILIVMNSYSKIGQAIALGVLLDHMEHGTGYRGYMYAAIIILCGMIAFPTKQHSFFHLYRKGCQYRTGLIATIYAKTLKLPSIGNVHNSNDDHSNNVGTSGHVTNLASNDVERFVLTAIYTNQLLASPFEICTVLGVGIYTIGNVFLVGYILLFLLAPLQFYLSRKFVVNRQRIAKYTDARTSLISQAITGVRVLKLQGWELELQRKIAHLRQLEVQQLQTTNQYKAWNDAIYYISSLVIEVFVLGIYVIVLQEPLTPRIVFTTFTLWNLLQYSVTKHIPHAIMGLSECYVGCQRIQTLLELQEQQPTPQDDDDDDKNEEEQVIKPANVKNLSSSSSSQQQPQQPLLRLAHATCHWNRQLMVEGEAEDGTVGEGTVGYRNIALNNITLTFQPGTLYCVIGKVGSGKSALLQAIIGELPVTNGSMKKSNECTISYAGQDPWIMDGTAKENIVMGQEYNPERYNEIIDACCLQSDFDTFLNGDETIVGDRGIQCSGGQKARLSLARALYNTNANLIVLDDPLSAVDSQVAYTIYYKAIQELCIQQENKCVVLVTHQHQFVHANKDNVCILLDQGQVLCYGSYQDCLEQSKGILSEALQMTQQDENEEEGAIQDVKEPSTLIEIDHSTKEIEVSTKINGTSSQKVEENWKEQEETADDLDDDKEGKQGTAFMEKRTTGIIRSHIWLSYGKALGGLVVCVLFFLIFSLTQALFLLTMTYVGKWAEAKEQDTMHWYGLVFGLTISTVVLAIIRAQMSFYLFLQASERLHDDMLHSVLHATIEFYDTNPLGRILNRFAADVGISDELLPFTIYDFGVGFIMFVGSIITAIVILPPVLFIFPFLCYAFVRLRRIFVQTTRELKRLEGLGRSPIYAMMSESLYGIATIRANHHTHYFSTKFETLHNQLIQSQFAFIAVSRWFATKLDLLSFIFLSVATIAAVVITDQGWFNLDPSIVGLALSLLLQLAGANFPFMVRQSAEVTNHMVSVERIWEFGHLIPQEAPLITEFDQQHPNWPQDGSIVVDNVQTRYRANLPPCLQKVSFTIQSGERVGVVGRTGAGKTSLLQTLFRVLEVEEGTIHIGGVNISQLGLHKLRTNMAVITQSPVLFSGCTIRENLDPDPETRTSTSGRVIAANKEELHRRNVVLETALRNVHMWETIQSMPQGLDSYVAEGGTNFSVGQRQLLCLARALLKQCDIIVLDEASANVDQATDQLLQQTLRERFASATIIAIAHRLDTIMDYDKVLVLGNGRVLEYGPPAQLLEDSQQGVFASMVKSTGPAMAEILKQKMKKLL